MALVQVAARRKYQSVSCDFMKSLYYYSLLILISCCNSQYEITTSTYSNGNPKVLVTYLSKSNKSDYNLIWLYETGEIEFKATVRSNKFIGEKINLYKNGIIKEIDSLASPCELNYCCCDGKITKYDSLGNISEFWYNKNGLEDGLVHVYKENGKIDLITTYVAGKKHGIEKGYYDNGQLEVLANYINDTIADYLYFFKENGDTLKYYNHFQGKIDFPYKKWLENKNILYGNYLDKTESRVLWIWYDEQYKELKRLIKNRSKDGYVVPE